MGDSTFTVQRSTTVDAPPERIYGHITDFRQWRAWSPWEDLDPNLTRAYSGPESGAGASYAWSGNRKAGQGRMKIIDADSPRTLRVELVFEKPWKSRNDVVFSIEPAGDGSLVTWSMTGPRPLMLRLLGFVMSMEKMIGPDFEKGLARLKAAAESPKAP
ncbi:SRPBCC family protein [Frankia sp. CNm7]|uniref:SRPBCC family protein n=1 Tax=Frankia nepalensis TaxID=1836974 RepID=A0A937ULU6_9ACTN|nr:SRPBCC family protein [Frankia nepalensis]MBL7496906.1 SRPBCC family protein [Frankia nepalensis]MBL7508333.1 SRPBCC family protein [Frankia nepalensis]MBL7524563.1 SRPBCC family protein [Frankia nepalensis]MBL7626162.1 SRPBCC family protein [Frankia nepalensis]